jgi:hypothetical protein
VWFKSEISELKIKDSKKIKDSTIFITCFIFIKDKLFVYSDTGRVKESSNMDIKKFSYWPEYRAPVHKVKL